jgi:hypothetical protein
MPPCCRLWERKWELVSGETFAAGGARRSLGWSTTWSAGSRWELKWERNLGEHSLVGVETGQMLVSRRDRRAWPGTLRVCSIRPLAVTTLCSWRTSWLVTGTSKAAAVPVGLTQRRRSVREAGDGAPRKPRMSAGFSGCGQQARVTRALPESPAAVPWLCRLYG